MSIITINRKAKYDYNILETFEAGLLLKGYEVKSIKTGRISLQGSFVIIKDEEAFLTNADIPPYQPKNMPADYNPTQTRKLLLHKSEIKSLIGKTKQKGLTLVPLRVYTKGGKIKLGFGLAKGKKKTDKREKIKKRETEIEIRRKLKQV